MLSSSCLRTSTLARCVALACPSSGMVASAAPSRGMAGMAGRDVRMRVILREDSKLGLKHDVVTVKRGYGRNVLVRQGKADYATEEMKHRSQVQQLRENAAKAQPAEAELAKAADASASASAAAAASASAAAALSVDTLRFQMDLAHRISGQRSPLFLRVPSGREGLKPVTLMDVYVKITGLFPSLQLQQLSFANGSQALTAPGEYGVHVQLAGVTKPAVFKTIVKKNEARPAAAATRNPPPSKAAPVQAQPQA